jgi:hypothetical protein
LLTPEESGLEETIRKWRGYCEKDDVLEGSPLSSWQLWYVKHVFCKGGFKMLYGRKGPRMVCMDCYEKEAELGAETPPAGGH